MSRPVSALPQILAATLLFAALVFGSQVAGGMHLHSAVALAGVSGLAFGAFVGLWRLVRGH